MSLRHKYVGKGLAVCLCALAADCTPPAGGSGGDPLDQFELDNDAAFDAKISTITMADNRILVCLDIPDDRESFTDQELLDAIKRAFGNTESPPGAFAQFVDAIAVNEPTKADEICDTQPGDNAALDAGVARLTLARNRIAGCTGGSNVEDAESFDDLKRIYFQVFAAVPPMEDFAEAQADAAEVEANATCSP